MKRTKKKSIENSKKTTNIQIVGMRYKKLISLLIIIVLGVIVYSNSFECSFHFDDFDNIVNNTKIHDINDFESWWNYSANRPLSMFTFVLNYHFSELDVYYYHVVNILIHIINAMLVYWLSLLLLSSPTLRNHSLVQHKDVFALLVALLFVSHPLATQSVTYIIQRQAAMAALFYLLSIILYFKARLIDKEKRIKKYFLFLGVLLSAFVAIFSKENAYTLPFVIVLCEIFFLQTEKFRINFKDYRIYAIFVVFVSVFIIALTKFSWSVLDPIPPAQSMGNIITITPANYLLTQFSAILKYIQLLVLPIGQNVDHDFPVSMSILELRTIMSLVVLCGIVALAVWLFKKNRIISFGIFWFLITISIESSFIPITDVFFEHRTYLPSFGFFIIFVSLIFILLRKKSRTMPIAIVLIIVSINSVLAFNRNKVWKDDISLWTDAMIKSPNKARPYGNLGVAYGQTGQWDKAIEYYTKSIEISPIYSMIYYNRGVAYANQQNWEFAIADYNKAIEISPDYAVAHFNRGIANSNLGNLEIAINDFSKAIELDPSFTLAYFNRGFAYFNLTKTKEAIEDYSKAIETDSLCAIAYANRGVAYFSNKDYSTAITDFTNAIKIDSKSDISYYNRGLCYYNLKQYDEAVFNLSKAIEINPDYLIAYFDRANIYTYLYLWDKAIADYTTVLNKKPDHVEAYLNREYAMKMLQDQNN
ncbi:MAG TPA: tetratricopeptide repeat protein [Bacteroidales bacterium]|nr:tetratricopeptide repeat protein [Bacteroidales bacterium]